MIFLKLCSAVCIVENSAALQQLLRWFKNAIKNARAGEGAMVAEGEGQGTLGEPGDPLSLSNFDRGFPLVYIYNYELPLTTYRNAKSRRRFTQKLSRFRLKHTC